MSVSSPRIQGLLENLLRNGEKHSVDDIACALRISRNTALSALWVLRDVLKDDGIAVESEAIPMARLRGQLGRPKKRYWIAAGKEQAA